MTDILIRWATAFALVAATYNPTDVSYVRWTMANAGDNLSVAVLAGLVLLAIWIIFLRATLRAIGPFGMTLVAAIFAALVWVLHDLDILSLASPDATGWLGIVGLSLVLGVGLAWSHVRRRLSGQVDIDDVDEA